MHQNLKTLENKNSVNLVAGEAKLGFIYKDDLAERRLKAGDVYIIPAGSPFYLVNVWEGQRLYIICSIDPTESLGADTFHVCIHIYMHP